MKNDEKDKDVLYRIDGRGVILKIKQALEIGKMLFSFVQYGKDNKATASIDCYIKAEEFGALLAAAINSGSLLNKIYKEKERAKAAGEEYPNKVWESPIGGKKTNTGAISRSFSIAPGSRSEVLFTATEYPADVSDTGAYIAKKGSKPSALVRVPATYEDLKVLAYVWRFLENDYMSKKYTVANMKSDYVRGTSQAQAVSTGTGKGVSPTPATSVPDGETTFAEAEVNSVTTTSEKEVTKELYVISGPVKGDEGSVFTVRISKGSQMRETDYPLIIGTAEASANKDALNKIAKKVKSEPVKVKISFIDNGDINDRKLYFKAIAD